ncbi:ABC transporter substrate-binding protein [Treponema pedis]|uniref:ABC transporter substrate-binding protein n=1 Tax=Treponema pedis TaxID=409322 RepID=UPI003D21AEBD
MKNFIYSAIFILLNLKRFFICVLVLFLFSCKEILPPDGYLMQPACNFYTAVIEREGKELPDFSCPPILISGIKVEGCPENLQWYTSNPKDYSSSALKKGGKFYAYLNDIPDTFRYVGPGANDETRKLFNTQMPFLWLSQETLEFMPCAATCWALDIQNKTVYYKLNENMFWSDGVPCTANDWLFAAKFLKSKLIVDPLQNYRAKNLEIKKINDYCVSVKYLGEQVYSEYELLDITNFKPIAEHFYGGEIPKNWIEKYNRIVEPTTGPYILTEYDINHGLKFTKVKNWWAHSYPHFKGVANFDEIYYRIIVGRKAPAFRKFALGMFDIIHIDNYIEWDSAETSANVKEGFVNLWKGFYVPVSGPTGIFFNTQAKPLDNIFVRQGLYYAIDMDGLIDKAFAGQRKRLHTMGVGQTWGKAEFNNPDIVKPSFNPQKAMEFFAKAGYKTLNSSGILVNDKGEELSFFIFFKDEQEREIFGFLYAQALKAGVNLEFKYYSGGMTNKISSRDYQAWWGALPSYRIPDNYTLLHSSFANKKTFENFFGYSNPELDRLLERFNESGLTYEEKAVINREIEKIVDEAALMVPSYYKNTIDVMAWKWICFPSWLNMRYQNNLDNPMFGYMWFDAEIEAECKKAKAENKMLEENSYSLSGRYK